MRTEEKTNISINLFINEAPGLVDGVEKPETRHVLLNLDAVIINEPNTKSHDEQFDAPSTLETLERIHKLFISKSAEPWLQKYSVETSSHQTIFEGTSDETCCCESQWTEKRVYFVNSKNIEILNIQFGTSDYLIGSHERSFALLIPKLDKDDDKEWTQFGHVKLQEVAGCVYINSLVNTLENVHLSGRMKPHDSFKIISDNDETVAIIDLQRTSSKLFQFINSYMLTFKKRDLSFHSRALVMAAIICYDIGFHRRQESIKCIVQSIFWFSFLFVGAFLLFLFLQWI